MKPFDLEAALRGEPAKTRDGCKAFILGRVPSELQSDPFEDLVGYLVYSGKFCETFNWREDGKCWEPRPDQESEEDLIGMWEESDDTVTVYGHTFPRPISEPLPSGTHFWYVEGGMGHYCAEESDGFPEGFAQFVTEKGCAHKTREAAEAHAAALNEMYRQSLVSGFANLYNDMEEDLQPYVQLLSEGILG